MIGVTEGVLRVQTTHQQGGRNCTRGRPPRHFSLAENFTGRQLLRQMRFNRCARRANRHGSRMGIILERVWRAQSETARSPYSLKSVWIHLIQESCIPLQDSVVGGYVEAI